MLATIIGATVFDHILLWHTRQDFIFLSKYEFIFFYLKMKIFLLDQMIFG